MASFFTRKLLDWNRGMNDRQMPWKGEKDPYRIWISEIILQQTRVEQGWAYYERFIASFPDIQALATAPDEEIFKHWEGLGYYSRCRNLIFTARQIHVERKGMFPNTYPEIAALKGIGPYTAAAIASFAFGLPYAVVDGNVIRVISRVFGIDAPADQPASRKLFTEKAQMLLDVRHPAEYNQAIMDFGATICKPQSPRCSVCPFQSDCQAYAFGRIAELPVKSKKIQKKKRFLHYLILEYNGQLFIRKRTARDIWQQLFEFHLIEADRLLETRELLDLPEVRAIVHPHSFELIMVSGARRQLLSHQELQGGFFHLKLNHPPSLPTGYQPVSRERLRDAAFPRFILSYLEENAYFQSAEVQSFNEKGEVS
jgi:A/G-specific adenine glycosylase